jgi:putative endonuclease
MFLRRKKKPEIPNVGVEHGRWGEDVAADFLRRRGYIIVERNVRPCKADERLEIDIVAYSREADAIVFVEVKQHAEHSEFESRLRSIDRRKRMLMRRVCRSWLMVHKWAGAYRFDVIEVFGTPESKESPEIDHIERVDIFVGREKFVNWCD